MINSISYSFNFLLFSLTKLDNNFFDVLVKSTIFLAYSWVLFTFTNNSGVFFNNSCMAGILKLITGRPHSRASNTDNPNPSQRDEHKYIDESISKDCTSLVKGCNVTLFERL